MTSLHDISEPAAKRQSISDRSLGTTGRIKMASVARAYILNKKRQEQAGNQRCQKCLQIGHWTYECNNKRKYLQRDSRTAVIKKKIKLMKSASENTDTTNSEALDKEKETSEKSSSDESDESDSDSDESSTSDDSDSSDDSSSSSSGSSSSNSSSSSEESDSDNKRKSKKR
ncbi:zinc finger CCHC domain-containing protein 10-like isoform X1 [Orbicella faveolata]|uniref:zinc finger CCHC domain-containing protein 10-like isoform X1 n=1 Tax=Orbicella faveolata TaxID=48498 RepID=UPI0009E1C9C1|nr:zinc finger CCHC domain-containing protein 10-like isoform X1 [Orbicella faveolata]